MHTVHAFQVAPALPESLERLRVIAYNLRWSWDHDTIELFRSLDRPLWETCGHNPVRMLGEISLERLQDAASDEAFLAELDRIHYSLESYLRSQNTWYRREWSAKLPTGAQIAYFCMEFGITECLPIYSGGLGILAGDHLKSSSDLGIPLVGVGLLYQQGYFHQALNSDGWQVEKYPDNDFYIMPIQPVLTELGEPLQVQVEFPGRFISISVWKAQVGRTALYMLDTNVPQNSADDQNITDQLYGGDTEMRLKQEIVLGIGGMRALAALNIHPTLCHMNEGHSAFLSLERARMLMTEHGCNFQAAREAAAAGNLFTTHTPVPAGFDIFPLDMMRRYFSAFVETLKITMEEFLNLGRVSRTNNEEQFNMAVLAIRASHHVNGVSRLHGKVTRRMVQAGYPGFTEEEVPVTHITNGIHTRSFVSQEMAQILDRYLGGRWSQDVSGSNVWARVEDIPDEELWRVFQQRREKLVRFARVRLQQQLQQRNRPEAEIRQAKEALNPDALTIGFARRFATYKRSTLLLSDTDRLLKLLNDPQRPVQILIAGKAHPRDDAAKELIRRIFEFAHRPQARNNIVFLEDYDIMTARHLVQGVDVWLNTPRRPMEASGTSGMKILANGGLNISILDGWWAEGYNDTVGWAIGNGEEYADPDVQDRIEANDLFEILEDEVVPLFYDRGVSGLPRAWIARIKNSMRQLCPVFNTHRMVSEYAGRFYFPSTIRFTKLTADNLKRADSLVLWKQFIRSNWSNVKIEKVETVPEEGGKVSVGESLRIKALVQLDKLSPTDVSVEAYHGRLGNDRQVKNGEAAELSCSGPGKNGLYTFEGKLTCGSSGLKGFAVRALPSHPDAELPQELPLITWEE